MLCQGFKCLKCKYMLNNCPLKSLHQLILLPIVYESVYLASLFRLAVLILMSLESARGKYLFTCLTHFQWSFFIIFKKLITYYVFEINIIMDSSNLLYGLRILLPSLFLMFVNNFYILIFKSINLSYIASAFHDLVLGWHNSKCKSRIWNCIFNILLIMLQQGEKGGKKKK